MLWPSPLSGHSCLGGSSLGGPDINLGAVGFQVEETRAGAWEGQAPWNLPRNQIEQMSAESEEAGSWDRWQVGRPGACYPDRLPLYCLADQSHDVTPGLSGQYQPLFELPLLLQIDPRSHVDNTPERFTDSKVLLHSVHAHSPAGYTEA